MGSIVSLLLSPVIIVNVGVSAAFYIYGSLGFLWLAAWDPMVRHGGAWWRMAWQCGAAAQTLVMCDGVCCSSLGFLWLAAWDPMVRHGGAGCGSLAL